MEFGADARRSLKALVNCVTQEFEKCLKKLIDNSFVCSFPEPYCLNDTAFGRTLNSRQP
jgi:hypothetical protein